MDDLLFEKTSTLPVPAETAFAWHERPGAFERLTPPWEPVQLVSHEGIHDGQRAVLRLKIGGVPISWVAEHRNYQPGVSFEDVQVSGPFAKWEHTHTMTPVGESSARLTDSIRYRLPGGSAGAWIGGRFSREKLERMFRWRHKRTIDDLACHLRYQGNTSMKVIITGGTGMIGRELQSLLNTGGNQAIALTRGAASGERQRHWEPAQEEYDPAWFAGCDAVVHLAGENVAGHRWTKSFKEKLWNSRIDVTRKLVSALKQLEDKPHTLISASAIGWYGDRGDELLDENAPAGAGFLCDLCTEWEAASHNAKDAGIRVVNPRIGVVLSPEGGALAKMLFPFKMGGGGVLGSGKQYMSWIGLDDVAGAIHHALMTDSIEGPVNCVAPHPVTNREFTKTLGKVLNRPTILPMPGFAARLAFGEMAEELLLASTRVKNGVLESTDYKYRTPTLEECLRHQLGR
jgi:uncharacterized protein (TIGR01777 family)